MSKNKQQLISLRLDSYHWLQGEYPWVHVNVNKITKPDLKHAVFWLGCINSNAV